MMKIAMHGIGRDAHHRLTRVVLVEEEDETTSSTVGVVPATDVAVQQAQIMDRDRLLMDGVDEGLLLLRTIFDRF